MLFITVHGTKDGRAVPAGDGEPKWWQPESAFSQDLVAAAGGGSVEPFLWSGENSELDRREGAEALLQRLQALEAEGRAYVLIGHSHGGSVIRTALRFAAGRDIALDQMQRWVTVGTPFLEFRPKRYWLSRLNLTGQMVGVFLLAALAGLGAEVGTWVLSLIGLMESTSVIGGQPAFFRASAITSSLVVALTGFWLIRNSQQRVKSLYAGGTEAAMKAQHYPRWTSLWDASDEAISGLVLASASKPYRSLPRNFMTGPLKTVGAILLLGSAMTPFQGDTLGLFLDDATVERLFASPFFVLHAPLQWLDATVSGVVDDHLLALFEAGSPWFYPAVAGQSLATVAGWGAILFVGFAVLQLIASGLSRAAARIADGFIWGGARTAALGNDTVGEVNGVASAGPSAAAPVWKPFPEPVSEALYTHTATAAAESLNRIQDGLKSVHGAADGMILARMLSQSFSWNEMIHTSYFKAPLSRSFILHATLQTSGIEDRRAPSEIGSLAGYLRDVAPDGTRWAAPAPEEPAQSMALRHGGSPAAASHARSPAIRRLNSRLHGLADVAIDHGALAVRTMRAMGRPPV